MMQKPRAKTRGFCCAPVVSDSWGRRCGSAATARRNTRAQARFPADSRPGRLFRRALTTAGAELHITQAWSFLTKFDGEFAKGSQTYAGTGTLRYIW
jgi:hypothetical protein